MPPAPDPTLFPLLAGAEALAAIGAWHRARLEGLRLDPRVESALEAVVRATGAATASSDPVSFGMIQALFLQAADLFSHPHRPPGWSHHGPEVVQAQGQASAMIPGLLSSCAELVAAFSAPGGRFLDVGVGAGWLSIAAAERWPSLTVTGIDPWDTALQLATGNVADRALGARITLVAADIRSYHPAVAHDVLWLPMPFLDDEALPAAIEGARRCLRRGGWLVFGLYAGHGDALSESLARLRSVRSGGTGRSPDEIQALVAAAGFVLGPEIARPPSLPMRFFTARSP